MGHRSSKACLARNFAHGEISKVYMRPHALIVATSVIESQSHWRHRCGAFPIVYDSRVADPLESTSLRFYKDARLADCLIEPPDENLMDVGQQFSYRMARNIVRAIEDKTNR